MGAYNADTEGKEAIKDLGQYASRKTCMLLLLSITDASAKPPYQFSSQVQARTASAPKLL